MMGFAVAERFPHLAKMSPEERKKEVLKIFATFLGNNALNPILFVDENFHEDKYLGGCPTCLFPPGLLTSTR